MEDEKMPVVMSNGSPDIDLEMGDGKLVNESNQSTAEGVSLRRFRLPAALEKMIHPCLEVCFFFFLNLSHFQIFDITNWHIWRKRELTENKIETLRLALLPTVPPPLPHSTPPVYRRCVIAVHPDYYLPGLHRAVFFAILLLGSSSPWTE